MKKINQILQKWPPGTVITSKWLKTQGVYKQLAHAYETSGWLERIGQGAYKRKGSKLSWEGGLYALQTYQHLPVHIGGRTALELQGFAHYLKLNSNWVILWKTPRTRLPQWFQEYDWKADLKIRSATLFQKDDKGLTTRKVNQIEIILSTPERAALEYLYDVPGQEGMDEAHYIMEGLSTLRPSVLQSLLEACQSVKVKRLFLFMAEHHDHSWFKKLDPSSISLGSGKREIVKGGKLNKKYNIVVPELTREDQ